MTQQPDRVDEVLVERRTAMIDDLAGVLDLESGLAEVLLADHHARLRADVQNVLDVDAGLAVIVAPSAETRSEPSRAEALVTVPSAHAFGDDAGSSPAAAAERVRHLAQRGLLASYAAKASPAEYVQLFAGAYEAVWRVVFEEH